MLLKSPRRASGAQEPAGFAERDVAEWSAGPSSGFPDHSGLAPENLTTLPHFSISSVMSVPKAAGEPGITVPPTSASRALSLESAKPALISMLRLSTILLGVFLGAATPYQALASLPGKKSPTAGRSGSGSQRLAVVTASARSAPDRMC